MNPVTVAIVDDHKLFSRSLEVMVNRLRGYSVLFTASDGLDFIHKVEKQRPDIVIMDQWMPIMDGATTVSWLRQNLPGIAVIVLSMNYNEEVVLKMVKSGVKGYLLKDAELNEFKDALQAVSNGGYYYPEYITTYIIKGVSPAEPEKNPDTDGLRPHEIEFIKLASTELTYKEIADQMNVSIRTVDGYRDQLFQRLNIKSRVGLVLFAVRTKLVDTN